MPTNDYIGYMKEDIFKNLDTPIEIPAKPVEAKAAAVPLKESKDQGLDPIVPIRFKSVSTNTNEISSYNTT